MGWLVGLAEPEDSQLVDSAGSFGGCTTERGTPTSGVEGIIGGRGHLLGSPPAVCVDAGFGRGGLEINGSARCIRRRSSRNSHTHGHYSNCRPHVDRGNCTAAESARNF